MSRLALYPAVDLNAVIARTTSVLTEIYQPEVNLAIWQRQLSAPLQQDIRNILATHQQIVWRAIRKSEEVYEWFIIYLRVTELTASMHDVQLLVNMFSDLFDSTHVGLRLELLNRAMRPRFRVDKLMCRLITTY